jgi:pimeloyl-ACP methyl ester carboxylesterase
MIWATAFREGPYGDTPVLLLSGTLDGRTYVESQAEALAGMSEVTTVIVRNSGHNLFMENDEVHAVIHRFMRGEPVGTGEILAELPDFMEMPF